MNDVTSSGNLADRDGNEPKDRRAATSPAIGKLGGAPKGSGFKPMHVAEAQRLLLFESWESVATKFGVCVNTLKRRIRSVEDE